MFRATLKSLLSRKIRLILSGIAVVLAMAFYTGADVLANSMTRSFESLFTSVYANVDAQVLGQTTVGDKEDPNGSARKNLPESLVDQVKAVPGVASAHGEVSAEGARVIDPATGKVLGSGGGAPRFGAAWSQEGGWQLRSGREPAADNEIAINGSLAKSGKFKVGDTINVLTLKPKQPFTLVGIFGYDGGRDSLGGETIVAFTKPAAQQLMLGESGVYTAIDVKATSGVTQDSLKKSLKSALPGNPEVLTQKELTESSTKGIAKFLDVFKTALQVFAFIALFVGMFLILNTFSMLITQRLRELALYRAMGANRRQVITAVLIEAVVVGLVSSAIGIAVGVGLGSLLKLALTSLTGTDLPNSGISLAAGTIVQALIYGTLATIVAALFPAIRASRIPPIAAMRDAATPDRSLTRLTIAGLVLLVPGVGLLTYALAGKAGDNTLKLLGAGALIGFIGVALLTPLISRPVVQVLGRVFSWNVSGKLGRQNSARNPRRTAMTAAALMIGIALVTGGSVIASSAKVSFAKLFDTGVSADLAIAGDQNGPLPPTFDGTVIDQAAKVSGVSTAVGVGGDLVSIGDQQSFVYSTDLAKFREVVKMPFDGTAPSSLGPNDILLPQALAKTLKVKVGDTVTTQFPKSNKTQLTVTGVLSKGWLFGVPVVSADDARFFRNPKPFTGYVKLSSGADIGSVQKELNSLLVNEPEVSVQNQKDLVAQQLSTLDNLVLILLILLGLAIVIAVLGVINTLALSVIERTRELGLLRAVGMRRSQLWQMITVESVVIAVFGAALGMTVGTLLGIAVVHALHDNGITELALPWGQMIAFLIAAVVAGLAAAVLPAIRAARLNVLGAISYE